MPQTKSSIQFVKSLPKPVSRAASLIAAVGLGVWASQNSGTDTAARPLLAIVTIAGIGLGLVKWHGIAFALFTMGCGLLPMTTNSPNASFFILTSQFTPYANQILLQTMLLIGLASTWFWIVSHWLRKTEQTQSVDPTRYRPIGIGDQLFHSLAGSVVLSLFLYFCWRFGHTQQSPNQFTGMTLLGVFFGGMVTRAILPNAGILWLIVAPLALNTIWAIFLSTMQSSDDIIDAWLNHQPLLNPIAALPSMTLSCTLIGLGLAIWVTNSVQFSSNQD